MNATTPDHTQPTRATPTSRRRLRLHPAPATHRRVEAEPRPLPKVARLLGPADPIRDVSIMGPSRTLYPDLLGGPDTITRVSVMGTPVAGPTFDLMGGSDPGGVELLFSPRR